MKRIFLTGAACAALTLAGCSGPEPAAQNTGNSPAPAAAGATGLTGAGATFPNPLYSKWFDVYKTEKGVEVNYQSIGSGAGIKQLTEKTVDFGATDAPLDDKGLKKLPGAVVQIPTVAGAVVLAYNLPGIKELKLSGPVAADIFLGTIKKWDDAKIAALNAGTKLPATAITVAHRSDGSGTTALLTGYLKEISPAWATKVGAGKSVNWPAGIGGKGNDGVTAVVKGQVGGIGYVELTYALKNGLSYASVQNKAGKFVAPTVESTSAAAESGLAATKKDTRASLNNMAGEKAYPIAGYTYILAYTKMDDPQKATALKDLLKWAVTDGQKMAAELHYAPLPAAVAELNAKAIDSIQ